VRRHDFVLKTFPEVFERVLYGGALENVNVLNRHFIGKWIHFDFQPGRDILLD
jgi:hypothetical protein